MVTPASMPALVRAPRKLQIVAACGLAASALCLAPSSTMAQPQGQTLVAPAAHPWLTVAQLRTIYGDRHSRYMTIHGMDVHYKDEGPRGAPVLFLVHGSVSSLRSWDRITMLLKGRYRVIRYDIPGFGLSGTISDGAAARVLPTDIPLALLDALGVRKATVVGVSSGGTMGMYLVARRPELFERLILSNTPSDPVKTGNLVQPPSFLAAQARVKSTGFSDQDFWNEFLSYFSGKPGRISAGTRREYYDFGRRFPEKHPIAMVARIGDGKQATIEMAKITAPTMLIWGGADPLLPKPAADAIERYLAAAPISRAVLPDVGHYPPLEVPDRFARLMVDYIEAVTPKSAP